PSTPTTPPPSTLFPYTTLFRSVTRPGTFAMGDPPCLDGERDNSGHRRLSHSPRQGPATQVQRPSDLSLRPSKGATASAGNFEKPDRKSTRLNSSHGSISYAVFC